MAFTKITTTELNSRGATTLPNQPTISATALKQEFDAPAKQIVAPKFNNLVDELEANTAASSLGAVAPEGRLGATVQAVINSVSSSLATLEASAGEAIAEAHTHPNKDLLDSYTQTDEALTSAVADDHTHSNKALLDTYEQTESDLADAVIKKHTHSNKDLLDTYDQTNADITDAISVKHAHSNKALLDTYTQSESDLADAVIKKHTHSNKALLDTYTQTEADLADAVAKKHTHSNKAVIDKFSDVDGEPYYDGNPIGGGTVNDAYKTVKVGSTNIVASGQDTLEIKAGSNVTLTPDATNKTVTISATGGGSSSGDMLAADYDSDFDVKAAGGIKTYVTGAISNKVDKVTGKGLSTNDYANEDKTIVGNAVTKSSISGLLKNDGTVDTTQYISDISGKADKVSSATNGNFAGLDSNGNLTDSGKKASDFLPSNTPIPDEVTANPQGTATGTLTKLGIGSSIYEIQGGGGGGDTSIISDDFDSSKTYAIDDYCIYNSILYRCIAPHTGSWDATHFENTTVGEELTSLNAATKTAVLVPWSVATDAQIAQMIKAYYEGYITLDDVKSVWSVGDYRDINISAIAASGGSGASAWNVGESHRAQTLQARIIDFNHDTLHTPINGITKALITVDTKNFLRDANAADDGGSENTERGYMNATDTNSGGWDGCLRRSWCNNAFYGALPNYIKTNIKEVEKPSSSGGSSPTIVTSIDKVFFPSMIEAFGIEYENWQQALPGEGTWYAYYNVRSNMARVPLTSGYISSGTFTRTSPEEGTTGFVTIDASCNVGANGSSTLRSIAPLWCM